MRTRTSPFSRSRKSRQHGQAALFLLLGMGLFLLGGIALAVDMGNLWMHRQAAQNAADAACTAAAMDMVNDANGASNSGGFNPSGTFNCSGNLSAAPCQYAAFNGYAASALTVNTPSTEVAISFPTSVPGVRSCSGSPPPSVCTQVGFPASAFVRATVTDRMQTFFAGLLSGKRTMDVGAVATCGSVLANSPVPLLILNPNLSGAFTGDPTTNLKIEGGPQRSIQVNSNDSGAVDLNGGQVDLSSGGPSLNGGDFGVTANETQSGAAATVNWGALPGQWRDPVASVSDPLAAYQVPAQPTFTTPAVIYGDKSANFGCPDTIDGCDHYQPGFYPTGITVHRGFDDTGTTPNPNATGLAVFEPGIYYLASPGLVADRGSCLRPSTATGDGSGGTLFYFSGAGSTLNISARSGRLRMPRFIGSNFDCQDLSAGGGIRNPAWAVSLAQIRCVPTGSAGATGLPANVAAFGGLVGNVLLGPCNAPNAGSGLCAPNCTGANGNPLNYGDPLGTNDPIGEQRGVLFFQDPSADLAGANNQPSWGGGGAYGLAGIMYFHNSSNLNDQLTLNGNAVSNNFVIGEIVVDRLNVHGALEMDLNANALYYVLKGSLLQ